MYRLFLMSTVVLFTLSGVRMVAESQASELPSPSFLLKRYEEVGLRFAHSEIHTSERISVRDFTILGHTVTRFYNDQVKKERVYTHDSPRAPEFERNQEQMEETVIDGEKELGTSFIKGRPDDEVIIRVDTADSETFPKNRADRLRGTVVSMLLGYGFFGDTHCFLPDILRKSKLRVIEQSLQLCPNCVVMETEESKYHIQIWFDRDNNYAVRKVVYERLPSIAQVGGTFRLIFDITQIQTIGGLNVPKSATVVQAVRVNKPENPTEKIDDSNIEKIPQFTSKMDIVFDKILFDKKFSSKDFAIGNLFDIPKYNKVSKRGVPQIEYFWVDGKIEPKTDELMLRIAKGDHKFIPSADEPRFWVIALGVLLIVIGFTAKIITVVKKWRNKK